MGKKFNDFVSSMNGEAQKKEGFNATERIETYKKVTAELYHQVDEWLREGIKAGNIKTGTAPITITEEKLGSYVIDSKWIEIGPARLELRPIGTMMIGTNARIDLIYHSSDVMIVRVGEHIEGAFDQISVRVVGDAVPKKKPAGKPVWKYVSRHNRVSYTALNEDSFQGLIMTLINENR